MKRRFALLLALTLAAPLALAQQAESPSMGPQLELTYENAGEADIVLIRNATIWTQDEGGVRENADLLIQDVVGLASMEPVCQRVGSVS